MNHRCDFDKKCNLPLFEDKNLCEKHYLRMLRYSLNYEIPDWLHHWNEVLTQSKKEYRRVLDIRKKRRLEKLDS
jgi:hypothetical protein